LYGYDEKIEERKPKECSNFFINRPMSKYRASAMAWWKCDLAKYEQQEMCDKYHQNRLAHTLTGNEIEKIWKCEN